MLGFLEWLKRGSHRFAIETALNRAIRSEKRTGIYYWRSSTLNIPAFLHTDLAFIRHTQEKLISL